MRFGSTAKVLLKCKLKYYRISECGQGSRSPCILHLTAWPAFDMSACVDSLSKALMVGM